MPLIEWLPALQNARPALSHRFHLTKPSLCDTSCNSMMQGGSIVSTGRSGKPPGPAQVVSRQSGTHTGPIKANQGGVASLRPCDFAFENSCPIVLNRAQSCLIVHNRAIFCVQTRLYPSHGLFSTLPRIPGHPERRATGRCACGGFSRIGPEMVDFSQFLHCHAPQPPYTQPL